MSAITRDTVALSNGILMPKLGLGTYQMSHDEVRASIPVAVKAGYRLIDTATMYHNEEAVGEAVERLVSEGTVKRSEVFLESKLAPADQGYEATIRAVDASLKKLRTDYIDLYIIHWPGASKLDPSDAKNRELRRDSWRALEELYRSGKCRAIGVSNYLARHLEDMRAYADVLPMVNQLELHPAHHPDPTLEWCLANRVAVQAYSSLAKGRLMEAAFVGRNPVLGSTAEAHAKSIPQVLLRWAWQHGYCIIPKSTTPSRIVSNAELDFVLSGAEMARLDAISQSDPMKVCWDPEAVA